jgi:hypothetical protein
MVSAGLMLACVAAAGVYLLAISIILQQVERRLGFAHGIPPELLETTGWVWIGFTFIMELMFYVIIPTLAYSFFYVVIPFSGIRAGMAAGLFAFVMGATPALMGLSVRVRLPMPFLLFLLFSVLLKVCGCMILIACIYAL